jgi:hypothetical protein
MHQAHLQEVGLRSTCLLRLVILIKHLQLSGMWLSVAPRTDTKKIYLKVTRLHAQNMITILGSIVNIIGWTYDHLTSMRMLTLIMNKIFI